MHFPSPPLPTHHLFTRSAVVNVYLCVLLCTLDYVLFENRVVFISVFMMSSAVSNNRKPEENFKNGKRKEDALAHRPCL